MPRVVIDPRTGTRFFELSRQYDENPYSEFYQVPCMIAGQISSEDRAWRFEINGGGTATWSANGQVRHWGCRAAQCEPLVLLYSDGLSGD